MEEQGKGYMTVNVRTAGGALPVNEATVTISNADGGMVIAVMLTDPAGRSDIIELPAPPKNNSLKPEGANVASLYTVDTYCEGYYEVIVNDIPIFDGVTSIQQILLVPVAIGDDPLRPRDLTRFSAGELPEL